MQIPHSFEYNSQKSINELYGNIPLIPPDYGCAAYRRGLQGILGICAGMENQSVRIAALSPSITTNILRMGQRAVQVQGLSLRCIVRHGTMFEGETCRLESGSMRFVCSSRARKISSCLLAKEIHVISYY